VYVADTTNNNVQLFIPANLTEVRNWQNEFAWELVVFDCSTTGFFI
jgi:hypothetical protein